MNEDSTAGRSRGWTAAEPEVQTDAARQGGEVASGLLQGPVRGPLLTLLLALGLTTGVRAADAAAPSAELAKPAAVTASGPVAVRPVEHFASQPRLAQVALSPDGRRYAAIVNVGDDTRVVTRSVDEPQPRVALSTDNHDTHIRWIRWVNPERIAIAVEGEIWVGRMRVVTRRLLTVRADGSGQVAMPIRSDHVVDWMDDDDRHLLMAFNGTLMKVDVETGERVGRERTFDAVWSWVSDARHQPRVRVQRLDEDQAEVLLREGADEDDGKGGTWRRLWAFKADSADAVWPLGFGSDPDRLFVNAWHQGRLAVFEVDLSRPGLDRRLVLAHATHDVVGQLLRSGDGRVIGIADLRVADSAQWWDPSMPPLVEALDRALPDRVNRVVQLSRDGQRYLLYSQDRGVSGRYYVGDRASGRLTLLGERQPELVAGPGMVTVAARVPARDGMPLAVRVVRRAHGSAPPGQAAGPAVLLVRDQAVDERNVAIDALTAFLVDRGYAVLEVGARGQGGQGRDFMQAGKHQWGLGSFDDRVDGLRWAVRQGLIDAQRVCMVGIGAEGGHSALTAAVRAEEPLRCVVSLNGVSELFDWQEHLLRRPFGAAVARQWLGHAWQDRERWTATSPARHVERFAAPVLLVHGTSDLWVPVAQSQALARALSAAGKPHELMEIPEGDHVLSRASQRATFMRALERFLARHLGTAGGA
jgi:dienelactone hydrolase